MTASASLLLTSTVMLTATNVLPAPSQWRCAYCGYLVPSGNHHECPTHVRLTIDVGTQP
jgi:hypothetical protein